MERASEVNAEHLPYHQAERVVVWLGEPSLDDLDTNPMKLLS